MSTTFNLRPQPIPLSVPCLGGREWDYVKHCLDTNWISSAGPFVTRFEQQLAERLGVPHAIATCTGTAALHVAMIVTGIEPNDEVIVPSLTFVASANAVRYAQAWPVFVDVESKHWQLDLNLVSDFLTRQCERRSNQLVNRTTGRRVRAILPVHVLGHPVDMAPLLELARRYDLVVIEDCAESLGARYRDQAVGSLGDVGCFSFNGNKTFTTGGGGMLVTRDDALAERARHLTTQAKIDSAEYIHNEVGFNYRLPNILAAVGCAQLEQFDSFLNAKRRINSWYRQHLADIPGLSLPTEANHSYSSCWLTTVYVDSEAYGRTTRELRTWLQETGIESRPLWQPMHRSPAHQNSMSIISGVADRLYENCLSLPSSVDLTDESLERIAASIRSGARGSNASSSHSSTCTKAA